MAIYWNVFGERAMSVCDDLNFTTVDRRGNIESWQFKPTYNKVTGMWDTTYKVYDEDDYIDGDWSRDGKTLTGVITSDHGAFDYDASLGLFPFATEITFDNWRSKSLLSSENADLLKEKEIGILEGILEKNLKILNDYGYLNRPTKLHDHAINVGFQRVILYLLKEENKTVYFKEFDSLDNEELEAINEKFCEYIETTDHVIFRVNDDYYFSERGAINDTPLPMMGMERAFLLYKKEDDGRCLMAKTEKGHYIRLV